MGQDPSVQALVIVLKGPGMKESSNAFQKRSLNKTQRSAVCSIKVNMTIEVAIQKIQQQ
jgi:hypothetical protein